MGDGTKKGGPDFGNAWTNYQVIYKYPTGINVSVHNSTLTAILGKEAASRQEKATWDELIYTPHKIDPNLDLKHFTGK